MVSFLSQIDMYGSKFHFKTFGDNKTTSSFGGIMTIATILILFLFTYLFGQDFFYRRNPKVTESGSLPGSYSRVQLSNENIVIPWRIEDASAMPVDPSGVLYPIVYYYSSERNPETSEFETYNYEYLNYYPCNSSDITLKDGDLPVGSYYCIDLRDLPIGGYWDGDFVNYFEIQIYFCPGGQPVNDGINCTNQELLKQFLNSEDPWYFSIYYPTHQFQPEDYNTPIKIHYTTHYTPINPITRKNDRLFFKEIQMIDDKGVVFISKEHKHYWVVDEIYQEFKYHPEEKLLEKGHTSKLYSMNVYVSYKKVLYSRIYEKIYNVMAVVGGFSQVVIMIIRIFCELMNVIKMKLSLINSCFYFDKIEMNYKIRNTRVHSLQIIKTLKEQQFQNSNSSEISFQPQVQTIMPIQQSINCEKIANIKNKNLSSCKTLTKESTEVIHKKNKIKANQYFCYQIHKNKCLRKILVKEPLNENNQFILAEKYIESIIDLSSYLTLFKEVLLFKHFFLSTNQLFALSNMRKYYLGKELDQKLIRTAIGFENCDNSEGFLKSVMKKGNETNNNEFDKFLMQFIEFSQNKKEYKKEKCSSKFIFGSKININNCHDTQCLSFNTLHKKATFRHSFILNVPKQRISVDGHLTSTPKDNSNLVTVKRTKNNCSS